MPFIFPYSGMFFFISPKTIPASLGFILRLDIFSFFGSNLKKSEFEKKKDHYNIYENELLPEDKTDENIKEYSQFEGLNDEWEDFNERDFENSGS